MLLNQLKSVCFEGESNITATTLIIDLYWELNARRALVPDEIEVKVALSG
jgi:hypothetical protein